MAAPPAFFAVLASIALWAVVARFEGSRSLAVNAWLLAIGSLALWFCWRVLASALPTPGRSAFDSVRDRPLEPPSRVADVIEIEAILLDAEWSWGGVEHRLRPLLRRIASARLMEKYQIDMESQPEAAQRILGDELWALVGPGAYGPETAPGGPGGLGGLGGSETGPAVDSTSIRTPTTNRSRGDRDHHRRGIPRATIKRTIELLEAL